MKDDPRSRAQEVAAVVDPLLADVWAFAWAQSEGRTGEDDRDATTALLLRMAYLQGYRDALEEPERGTLFRRFGIEVPPLKKDARRGSYRNRSSPPPRSSGTEAR